MVSPEPGDPTPVIGAPTDVSSTGRAVPAPAHEHTADEDLRDVNWNQIAAYPEFQQLLRRKARFIAPATLFFLAYYFALPALVGYARPLMIKHAGPVNLAYLFALSQFFMAWLVAAFYVRAANRFDQAAREILKHSR